MSIFATLDWVVVGMYFLIIIGIALWVISRKQSNTEDYFLAGRNIGWFIVGASIFASNIGSEHIVGLAGTGAASGMPMAHFELHAWIVLLLGWVFLPFYARSGVFTMPEFLEKRFNATARWYLSVISIVGYVLTKVSVSVYAGGVVIQSLMGFDFWTGAIITVCGYWLIYHFGWNACCGLYRSIANGNIDLWRSGCNHYRTKPDRWLGKFERNCR